MILVTLKLKVVPQKRWDVIQTVHTIIGPTLVQSGCLHCGFYSNTQNDDELILVEKWTSQKYLEKHVRSDDFRKILMVMDAAKKKPDISFITVESKAGLELVEKIRSGGTGEA